MPVVYLLHFIRPHPNGQRPQHYLGVAHDLSERLRAHELGSSKSKLTRDFHSRGIGFVLARTWERKTGHGVFNLERRLKSTKKGHRRICPICTPTTKGNSA